MRVKPIYCFFTTLDANPQFLQILIDLPLHQGLQSEVIVLILKNSIIGVVISALHNLQVISFNLCTINYFETENILQRFFLQVNQTHLYNQYEPFQF